MEHWTSKVGAALLVVGVLAFLPWLLGAVGLVELQVNARQVLTVSGGAIVLGMILISKQGTRLAELALDKFGKAKIGKEGD